MTVTSDDYCNLKIYGIYDWFSEKLKVFILLVDEIFNSKFF